MNKQPEGINDTVMIIKTALHVLIVATFTCLTCKEFRMPNIQANALDSWLTARTPNTHVIPSRGRSITEIFNSLLLNKQNTQVSINS